MIFSLLICAALILTDCGGAASYARPCSALAIKREGDADTSADFNSKQKATDECGPIDILSSLSNSRVNYALS